MPKKVHPADLATDEAIKRATHFTATIRKNLRNVTFETPYLAVAREAARLMPGIFKVNRGAIVYAVTPEGWSFMVPSNKAYPEPNGDLPMGSLANLASRLSGTASSEVMKNAAAEIGAAATKSHDDLEIPAGLKISAEDRAAAWKAKPPVIPAKPDTKKKEKAAKPATNAISTPKPADVAGKEKQETDMSRKSAKASGNKARVAVKAKATSAKKPASGERNRYDWNGAEEKANKGIMPPKPDFSAPTHERFRELLAEVHKAATAGNVEALMKIKINPISSSPKAVKRYRDLCGKALRAKANGKGASAKKAG